MEPEPEEPTRDLSTRRPGPAVRVVAGMLGLIAAGGMVFRELAAPEPPPAAIAGDPVLVRGREIYRERCVSCHGPEGRGDGPIAKGLAGPAPRNLVADPWKHGDGPEQVLAVLRDGVKDSAMPAWGGTYGPEELRSVAAYVYHLAVRPVPVELRPR